MDVNWNHRGETMLTNEELIAHKMARIQDVHRLIPSRTALLVIDMQTSFMDPKSCLAVAQAWDMLPRIKTLVDFCRGVKIPVIFTEFIYDPAVPCLRGDPFGPEHLPAQPGEPTGWGYPSSNSNVGATGAENPDTVVELTPLPDELVVRGHTLDKFYGTPLDLALRAQDIRYLIFTGLMADLCLGATLFSAAMRDYRVTALTDCITTIWPNILEAIFDIFGRKLARLMTSETVMKEITEQLGK
jgi:nicotinamidase-related amidase